MGHRTLGPKYLQQAICPGRVQLAVPGGRYLDRHRLRRPAISGRTPDLLAVPRRTQNLWRDAARHILIASIGWISGGGAGGFAPFSLPGHVNPSHPTAVTPPANPAECTPARGPTT